MRPIIPRFNGKVSGLTEPLWLLHHITWLKIMYCPDTKHTGQQLRNWSMQFNLLMHAQIHHLIYGELYINCSLSPLE